MINELAKVPIRRKLLSLSAILLSRIHRKYSHQKHTHPSTLPCSIHFTVPLTVAPPLPFPFKPFLSWWSLLGGYILHYFLVLLFLQILPSAILVYCRRSNIAFPVQFHLVLKVEIRERLLKIVIVLPRCFMPWQSLPAH